MVRFIFKVILLFSQSAYISALCCMCVRTSVATGGLRNWLDCVKIYVIFFDPTFSVHPDAHDEAIDTISKTHTLSCNPSSVRVRVQLDVVDGPNHLHLKIPLALVHTKVHH